VLASANPRAESKNIPDAPDGEQIDWDDDGDDANVMTANDRLAKLRMSNLVRQYLQAQSLEVLVEGGMEDAVMRFVEKDDRDAIKECVESCCKRSKR
jgi:double-strand break repair protein MRE11